MLEIGSKAAKLVEAEMIFSGTLRGRYVECRQLRQFDGTELGESVDGFEALANLVRFFKFLRLWLIKEDDSSVTGASTAEGDASIAGRLNRPSVGAEQVQEVDAGLISPTRSMDEESNQNPQAAGEKKTCTSFP